MSTEHIVPVRLYLVIFVTLLVLTAVTTVVAYIDLGPLNVIVMLAIACFKASLVILYFMHVRFTGRLTQLAAAGGFAWLLIMFALTMSDYLTRGIN